MLRCKVQCFSNTVYNEKTGEETNTVWFAAVPDQDIPVEQQVDFAYGSVSISMTIGKKQASEILVGNQFYVDIIQQPQADSYIKPEGSFAE